MSKAEAYINRSINETIIKLNQIRGSSNSELIIVLDIINPKKNYSNLRTHIFNNLIPNLNFDIPKIHFIYNDNGEAKYYNGDIKELKSLKINEISPNDNFKFKFISEKLRCL